jgi:general stress protein 26
MLAALAILATGDEAFSQASERDVRALSNAQLIYIATVRKDGNQSTSAPVWFTTTPDHMVLIQTGPGTWKAKRIRRGSPVLVWIGSQDGPAFIGAAEITKDSAVEARIIQDYPEKYLLARVGLHKPTQEKFDDGDILAIKITPVRDLPEHFANQPATPAPSLEPAPSAPSANASPAGH